MQDAKAGLTVFILRRLKLQTRLDSLHPAFYIGRSTAARYKLKSGCYRRFFVASKVLYGISITRNIADRVFAGPKTFGFKLLPVFYRGRENVRFPLTSGGPSPHAQQYDHFQAHK
jgi:hypothetical protein